MSRSKVLSFLNVLHSKVCLGFLLVGAGLIAPVVDSHAQKSPPANTATTRGDGASSAPAGTVLQLRRQISGDLAYRFLSSGDKSATAPAPLATPSGADSVVAVAVPSTVGKDGVLEVMDNGRGNIARIPVSAKGAAPLILSESSFTLAQRINIPVQSKGLGVIGVQVALATADGKYAQTRLLQPDDNGIARFDAVPLNVPITATVSYGSNPPESQTRTLTPTRPADAWPAIVVTWPEVKTVAPAPAAPVAAAPASGDAASRRASDDDRRDARRSEPNPINSIVSFFVSLLFLGGVGYGVFWAYKTGRLKSVLDSLGIAQAPAVAAPAGDPFARQRAPIQPITDGTADPFAGALGATAGAAPLAAIPDGPRLIATAGSYSGTIYPLHGAATDIGRDPGNAVPLPNDTNASRRHATIQAANGQYSVLDNGSSNGTFVNGVRIVSQTPQPLRAGDEVQIGMTRFRFEA